MGGGKISELPSTRWQTLHLNGISRGNYTLIMIQMLEYNIKSNAASNHSPRVEQDAAAEDDGREELALALGEAGHHVGDHLGGQGFRGARA
jgi:hypothetical protein